MLTTHEVISRLEMSFLPLHCFAEFEGAKAVRLRVYSDDEVVLNMQKLHAATVSDDESLASVTRQLRSLVEDKGFSLLNPVSWLKPYEVKSKSGGSSPRFKASANG